MKTIDAWEEKNGRNQHKDTMFDVFVGLVLGFLSLLCLRVSVFVVFSLLFLPPFRPCSFKMALWKNLGQRGAAAAQRGRGQVKGEGTK